MRMKVDDIKDFKNNRNYKGIIIKDGKRELKAYKANTMRIMRHLICLKEYKDTESRSDIINNGSNIKSRFKATTKL
jgi:hypothetical protein